MSSQLWHFQVLRASPLRWAAIGLSVAFAFYFYGQTAMVNNGAVDQEVYRVSHTMWHVMIALGQCFVSTAATRPKRPGSAVKERQGGGWRARGGGVMAGYEGEWEAPTGESASRRGGGVGGGGDDVGDLLGGLADMSVTQMRQLIDGDARLRAVSKAVGGPRGRSRLDMRRDIEQAVIAVG